MKRLLAYAAIYFLWGASFLGIRAVVAEVPPFFAAGFRFLSAGLILCAWCALKGDLRGGITRQQWLQAAALGGFLFTTCYGALFFAEQRVASGIAAVIAATIPGFVFLLEWLVLRRVRLNWASGLGLIAGLAGVGLLVFSRGDFKAMQLSRLVDRYSLLILGGSICWAAATVSMRFLRLPESRPLSSGIQMVSGGLVLLVVAAGTGELRRLNIHAITAGAIWGMVYLIIAASILAFTAYVWLLGREPATRVASYAYINPIVALAIGALFAGEKLTPLQLLGSGLVLAGVAATLLGKSTAEQPRAAHAST